MAGWLIFLGGIFAILFWYIRHNDRALRTIPPSALKHAPERWSMEQLEKEVERHESNPIKPVDFLPPKTGRRYIVVGGGGFVGGWIVRQLIQRGEDPLHIRILDIRPPTAEDMLSGPAAQVSFIPVDITNSTAVEQAFKAPWPSSDPTTNTLHPPEVTVFNTAASIIFYERDPRLLPRSEKVNVIGTRNILNESLSIGATILIYTSSCGVSMSKTEPINWPWSGPANFVQVLTDDTPISKTGDSFSNYSITKSIGDRMIREADRTVGEGGKVLRTGCLRPGHVIFGPNDQMYITAILSRKSNPSFTHNMLQTFLYVENCAEAHLRYEESLIRIQNGAGTLPDIGGQAFLITNSGPPTFGGEVYDVVSTLTQGEVTFPWLSPTALALFLAYPVEWYHTSRVLLTQSSSSLLRALGGWMPQVTGDILSTQPSMFSSAVIHMIIDDSRARLAPEEGGLGYKGAYNTLQGVVKTVMDSRRQTLDQAYKRPTFSEKFTFVTKPERPIAS